MVGLSVLNLACTEIRDSKLRLVIDNLPNLKKLSLQGKIRQNFKILTKFLGCQNLTYEGFRYAFMSPKMNLDKINLKGTRVASENRERKYLPIFRKFQKFTFF